MMHRPLIHFAWGILLCIAAIPAAGQDFYGRIGSNYSPSTSLWFNPALASDSRVFVDLHLTGVSLFANNTYGYIPGDQMRLSTFQAGEVEPAFNTRRNRHHAYIDTRFHGPALTVQAGKWNIGLTSAARSVTSIRGVPNSIIEMGRNGLQHPDNFGVLHQVDRMRVNATAWLEVGLNLAGIVKQQGRDQHSIGLHVRRLFPVTGASVFFDGLQFQVDDSLVISTENIDGHYAFHNPEEMENATGIGGLISGRGWGLILAGPGSAREVLLIPTFHSQSVEVQVV